jgi:hypothetical protein
MKEVDFDKGMGILMAAYPDYKCTPETVDLYRELLSCLNPKDFERAVLNHVKNHKWFPKVSEILSTGLPPRPSAIDAWQKLIAAAEAGVKPEMDFATRKALDFIGGWEQFGLTTYENLRFAFKAFKDAYMEAQEHEARWLVGGEQAALEGPA